MNERERFEEGTDHAFYKLELLEYKASGRRIEYMLAKYYGIYKKGKEEIAEIAKQDEKELVDILISIRRREHLSEIGEMCIDIAIEKHTGKTWEELNE